MAMVSGPISGGSHGWAFGESPLDVSRFGYRQDEFFLEGEATRYRLAPGTELTFDGRWHAVPAGTDAFKTRIVVLRPSDPSKFNGTVVVCWNNVSAGFDGWGGGADEVAFTQGFAYVGVSAQRAGLEGFGDSPQGLAIWDPERYGTLSIPTDDLSYDIFTQAVLAVGGGRAGSNDPMGGLDVRNTIAIGGSQSAARLSTYLNAIQPLTGAVDACLPFVYFGFGTDLEVGDAIVNPAAPDHQEMFWRPVHHIRDDVQIPVLVLNSESEVPSSASVRQPDSELRRWWEVAGSVHGSPDTLRDMARRVGRDLGIELPFMPSAFHASTHAVMGAALHHMHSWLNGDPPPPVQPLIELAGQPPEIVRDDDGIGRGGIRLPQAEVPLAGSSSGAQGLGLTYVAFPAEEARRRYGDRDTYLARFRDAADRAVSVGVLLPEAVDGLLVEAAAAFPDAD